ncbi:MAG: CAF17-like 4Fe-4S cluster assembly/insertion protein YgfZ [Acidimicrobiales bacterium]
MAELRHHRLTRDAAVVEGPEAAAYLQGQLSQDVLALAVGASSWSWLLAPAGKVDALVRVARTGDERFVVDTDAGWGDAVVNRLTRFRQRTKAQITAASLDVVAVRGAGAAEAGLVALWAAGEDAVDRPGGGDGPGRRLGEDEWEAERIAAGVPVMGAELTERTIPAETGLVPLTVNFTKGCYTGQELVARIDSRGGNVPRHLRLLRSGRPLEAGAELTAGGKVVGAVTSASPIGPVALGYVGRAVPPGASVLAGELTVEVAALPPRG